MGARPEPLSVGKYRFLVELGSGGMGDVFLAVAQGPAGFSKLQVIKRLRPELAEDPEFLAMFLDEARIAARLNHPNIVQTNEVSEQNREYFIAMEYLEGQSLHTICRRAMAQQKQRLPLAMYLHVLAEACEGLQYAHDLTDFDGTPLGLVHRDVSPQNVFVTYEGQVKILDFGIAKANNSATHTRTGVLKGKVPYMPPEQLEARPVDRRADVFALGAMMWEAATGSRLWKGFNDLQIANRLSRGDIPRPSELEPTVDPAFEALVMKALAPDPGERFQSAAELHLSLDAYVTKLGGVRRRDLARYVDGLFNDTRRSLRARLEEELRDLAPNAPALLPPAELPSYTGEILSPVAEEVTRADAPAAFATVERIDTRHSTSRTVPPLPAPPRSHTWLAALGGATLALLGAFIALRATQGLSESSTPGSKPTAASATPTPEPGTNATSPNGPTQGAAGPSDAARAAPSAIGPGPIEEPEDLSLPGPADAAPGAIKPGKTAPVPPAPTSKPAFKPTDKPSEKPTDKPNPKIDKGDPWQ